MGLVLLLLAILAVVCALGWFFSKQSIKIILCYMKEKGYEPPTDAELRACSQKVIEETFTLSRKNKH